MKSKCEKIKFQRGNKRLIPAIWCLCALYRMEMLFVPARKLEKRYGIRGEESSMELSDRQQRDVCRISRYVNNIADRTPWQSKCLVRARVAQYLIKRKGIESTLYLGVSKDEEGNMVAHAWVRSGNIYVTGGNGDGYAVVARFLK